MDKKAKLKAEIEAKKRELANLIAEEANSERNQAIKPLSEYTKEEKCKAFDVLYGHALANLVNFEKAKGEHQTNDEEHYAWEEVMRILGRQPNLFWNYYNKVSK